MTGFAARRGTVLLLILAALVMAVVPLVSIGFFTIDEVIYAIGARTLAETGHLGIDNGFGTFHDQALKLWFLRAGPDGLVPQYPVGSALAGAPLYAAFGLRGLIALNAAAIAATLFVTRALARRLYADEATALIAPLLLLFGSFAPEYAYGIWPHGVSVFCTVTALWLALRATDAAGPSAAGWAFLSGLSVGVGFLFRLDSVLILPVVAASAILFARRPVLTVVSGLAGLAPAVAVAAVFNRAKFGSLNPLSYGRTAGGDTDLSKYAYLVAGLAGIMVVMIALRLFRRGLLRRPAVSAAIALSALGLALALLPQLRHLAETMARGFQVLVLDIRPVQDARAGVVHAADGTVSFWGFYKKALGESLPWLGILPAIAARPWRAAEWRGHAILLAAALFWMLPFLPSQWHGGLGSNMRYFLPVVPLLSVLAARLWTGMLESVRGPGAEVVLWLPAGAALVVGWIVARPSGLGGAEQILPVYAFAAMAGLAALSNLPPRGRAGRVARALAWRGFLVAAGMAFLLGPVLDVSKSQLHRAETAGSAQQIAALPGPALVIAPPEMAFDLLGRPGYLVAVPDRITDRVDPGFVKRVLASGRRVFVARWLAAGLLDNQGLAAGTAVGPASSPVIEIVRANRD